MTVYLPPARIKERIATVKTSLPPEVRLIGVTKNMPVEVIRTAYEAGIRDFGESRVQEAIAKQSELQDLDNITWHLIGHLQTNKARKAIAHFDWIHSIDSLKLASRLNDVSAELQRIPRCCLQVKLRPDPSKYGFTRSELLSALPELDRMASLEIVGLMTIPPLETSSLERTQIFQEAQDLKAEINRQQLQRVQIQELSMGMSGDYAVAVVAGATLIRLGTTLFGARPT